MERHIADEAAARAAKQQHLLNSPPPETWSATMPAYAGTVLCADRRYRPEKSVS